MTNGEIPGQNPEENPIPKPHDFSLVPNSDLRAFLYDVVHKNKSGKEKFLRKEVQGLLSGINIVYAGGFHIVNSVDVNILMEKLTKQKIINTSSISIGNRTYAEVSEEDMLITSVFYWDEVVHENPRRFNRQWDRTIGRVIKNLGDHPLKDKLLANRAQKKLESVRKGSEADQRVSEHFRNPKTLGQINTHEGEMWKTPVGEELKTLLKRIDISVLREPFYSRGIANVLKLKSMNEAALISDLAMNGTIRGTIEIQGKQFFRAEHIPIFALYYAYLNKGYTESEAHRELKTLFKGSSLDQYLGLPPEDDGDRRDPNSVFEYGTGWRQLSYFIPEPQVNSETDSLTKNNTREKQINPTNLAAKEALRIKNYLVDLDEGSKEEASRIDFENFEVLKTQIRDILAHISFADISPRIAPIIVRIMEVNRKSLRDPNQLLEEMWSKVLRDYAFSVANIWRAHPEIKDLYHLYSAYQRRATDRLQKIIQDENK